MKIKHLTITALVAAVALSTACGDRNGHGLKGNIKGAKEDSYAVLEAPNEFGFWYAVDSAKVDSDGDFFIPYDAPSSPELYRVRYGDRYVYLPLDSTETLTLTTTAAAFDRGFNLAGSPQAERLTRFEREARRIEALADNDSTEAFKRRVYTQFLENGKGDMLSYYILSRSFGDGHLIEYTDPIYTAVANLFQTFRPEDPHTKALVERAKEGLAARRKAMGKRNVVEAPEVAIIDLDLPDLKGVNHRLSDNVGKGKPTVLVFTSIAAPENAALTRTLRSIYEEGAADIYEVCYDTDHLVLANGTKGLPWTVVRDTDGLRSENLLKYNVGALPTMFIYDSRGELSQRAATPDELRKLLPTVK